MVKDANNPFLASKAADNFILLAVIIKSEKGCKKKVITFKNGESWLKQ